MNAYTEIDIATEEGKLEEVRTMILEGNICPSLYSVQMAAINGHAATAFAVLDLCHNKLRSGTDIKTVHYNGKTKVWSEVIPKEFRY